MTDQGSGVDRVGAAAPVPTTTMDYVKALGPGLLVAMAWLSAGDLVSASVSGSTYGYALMWALVIALFARYFFVSAIGKYVLCNSQGDNSILAGFARLWRGLPLIVGVIAFILGFTYQTYIIKGAATALYQLLGGIGNSDWAVFVFAVLLVGVTIFMLLRGHQYRTLETIAKVSVGILMLTFFLAVAINGFDLAAFLRGLVFQVPADTEGTFGAVVILAAIIGAVGGSAANLLYPYFMENKGWTTPVYRKIQIFDLLVGIIAMVFINLAVWIVAAESLGGGAGIAIQEAEDLAVMMGRGVGAIGPLLLWIGLFFVTFTSFPAYSFGFTKVLLDGVQRTFPGGLESDEIPDPANHRYFKFIQIGLLLVLPLLFSLPIAPNFIALTIAGNAMGAITGPIIIVGVIILTTSKKYMLPEYANKWWETVALLIIGGIGLWATYGVVAGLLS
jgi:Mn2+/Fe2+ NRAMP family transporter